MRVNRVHANVVGQLAICRAVFARQSLAMDVVDLCQIGNSSRAGVWLIFGPMIGTRMSHEPPKMCLTP